MKGDAYALCTLAFQVALAGLFVNLVGLTGGPYGIAGIPPPSISLVAIPSPMLFVGLSVGLGALSWYLAWAVAESPFGRNMLAIRDNELGARSLGKNVAATRIAAGVIAGAMVALAGAVHASYFGYIDPSGFALGESFIMLSMVLIGGAGNVSGPVAGAAIMTLLPEALRLFQVPSTVAPNIRQMIFGALLVALMFLRPRGVLGRYSLQ